MHIMLRYLGCAIFYLAVCDKQKNEFELIPDRDSDVPYILFDKQLQYVENQFGLKYDPTAFDKSEFEPSDMSDDSLSIEKSDYIGLNSHSGTKESSDPGVEIISKQEFLSAVKRESSMKGKRKATISAEKSKRSTTIKRSKKKNTHKVPNSRYLDWGKFEVTLNTPILTTNRLGFC
ncbi:hypothetical protein PIB30_054986 [Stylosanthes scabra]|uniref:Uncharacterized protein n=1 Tax=Stylosanthes scabra TaxID=79078 RepID=A0ABU6VIJ6_9FABA|nr:hypothetical protein [Stylosanthes scabra]